MDDGDMEGNEVDSEGDLETPYGEVGGVVVDIVDDIVVDTVYWDLLPSLSLSGDFSTCSTAGVSIESRLSLMPLFLPGPDPPPPFLPSTPRSFTTPSRESCESKLKMPMMDPPPSLRILLEVT